MPRRNLFEDASSNEKLNNVCESYFGREVTDFKNTALTMGLDESQAGIIANYLEEGINDLSVFTQSSGVYRVFTYSCCHLDLLSELENQETSD